MTEVRGLKLYRRCPDWKCVDLGSHVISRTHPKRPWTSPSSVEKGQNPDGLDYLS